MSRLTDPRRAALLALVICACGGSTDGEGVPSDGGNDTSVGYDGTAGVAGAGSGGAAGTTSIDGGGGTWPCGDGFCAPLPRVPGIEAEQCCTDAGSCGASLPIVGPECLALKQPGTIDPECDSQVIEGYTLVGCCLPNGHCGVMDNRIGLGCVNPAPITGELAKCCLKPLGPNGCYTCKQPWEHTYCLLPQELCGWAYPGNDAGLKPSKSALKFFDVYNCMCQPGNCDVACALTCTQNEPPDEKCIACIPTKCSAEFAVCSEDDGT